MPDTRPVPGRPAPDLKLDLIIDAKWDLAEQDPGAFTMIVFYRGVHCPICRSFLTDLRGVYDDFLSKGVEVINVSMDTHEKATKAHEEWGLDPIPMGYALTEEQARAWGLYLSEGRTDAEPETFSEPGLALVTPDGTLYIAEASSAPFLRPDLKLLLSKIDMIREKDYPPRGTLAA
ncbi:redoxin domain-containing protein [uncultured Jannaschia sp.]|uniref:redoxin domain-containing protein n=1 Tax=uncultured Jannaschia sp. TaxID=293347 RepID=UPI00262B531B|nr:redoxin domain-containing protein [uncultured Jannaschia sp.]